MEMENVTAYVGETARLHCHVASENHGHDSEEEDPEPYSIEWFELESVNGSYVDSSGAPYAVQLEVNQTTLIVMKRIKVTALIRWTIQVAKIGTIFRSKT